MFRLGLTGSIATGKSTVLGMFAAKDYPVFSADEAVHALYQGEAVEPISKTFSKVVVAGQIDRDRLSKIFISDPARLTELEAIIHPMVRKKIEEFWQSSAAEDARLAVVDIPLLFETGSSNGSAYALDAIAVTFCSDLEQKRRALSRPGMSVEKLNTILAQQLPQAEKRRRADFEIDTNQNLAYSRQQVDEIIKTCLSQNDRKTADD